MIAEKIIRLHNIDIVDLRGLQNLPRALRAGNVRARSHLAPFTECALNPDLRPNADDRRHYYIEQPVMTSAESNGVEHSYLSASD